MKEDERYMQKEENVYLDLNRLIITKKSGVKIKDLGNVLCQNKELQRKIGELTVCHMQAYKDKTQVVSAMKVMDVILREYETVSIQNIGETDTIITFKPEKEKSNLGSKSKILQAMRVFFVGMLLFFGAAFSIMSFHTDVSIQDLFARIFTMMTGHKSNHFTILEISYSIGIFLGVLVFFNRFGKKKVTHEPTPVQVQMREYEKDVDNTFIENVTREGEKIDVE